MDGDLHKIDDVNVTVGVIGMVEGLSSKGIEREEGKCTRGLSDDAMVVEVVDGIKDGAVMASCLSFVRRSISVQNWKH